MHNLILLASLTVLGFKQDSCSKDCHMVRIKSFSFSQFPVPMQPTFSDTFHSLTVVCVCVCARAHVEIVFHVVVSF